MMLSLTLPIALLVSSLFARCGAEKDSNAYPWGSNPNVKNKMYWKDSPNVLEDLTKFSALYIKVHGCVWSEFGLGTSYDDDGENHDGDGNWYMSRTQPFRANAAFSLYGTLRDDVNFIGGCKKGTYINSFFTYLGADTIVKLFGLGVSAFPDASYGSNYCYEYQDNSGSNNKNGKDRRDLKSGDNNNNADTMSTTMGCAADGSFANAKFLGDDCDGKYFLNITDSLKKYNSAIKKVGCQQIWNYHKDYTGSRALGQNYNDDQITTTYGSIAEKLLLTSFACDLNLYPEACPNPYGLKAKYTKKMNSAAAASRKASSRSFANGVVAGAWQNPLLFFSWFFLVIAMLLGVYAYVVKNRRYVQKEGGGVRGLTKVAWNDVRGKVVKGTAKALSCDGPESRKSRTSTRTKGQKKASKKSKSGSQISSKKERDVESNVDGGATDFVIMPSERNHATGSSSKRPEKTQKMGFLQSIRRPRSQSENDDYSDAGGAEERYSPAKARQDKDGLMRG